MEREGRRGEEKREGVGEGEVRGGGWWRGKGWGRRKGWGTRKGGVGGARREKGREERRGGGGGRGEGWGEGEGRDRGWVEGRERTAHSIVLLTTKDIQLDQTVRNFPVFCGHFVCWERIMLRKHYLTLSIHYKYWPKVEEMSKVTVHIPQ